MNGAVIALARWTLGVGVLVVVGSSMACGAAVHLGPPDAVEYVAPLAIAGPHDELVYNDADDEDRDVDGIQLTVRVDLADDIGADIERVDLTVRDLTLSDVVTEDLAGRRAAFFDVTLAGTDTQVIARATTAHIPPGATDARVEVQAILRALAVH
jgi:hypothetical protein